MARGRLSIRDVCESFEPVTDGGLIGCNRDRRHRLAKDFENLADNALGFLLLVSIRLMLRRICNSAWAFQTNS